MLNNFSPPHKGCWPAFCTQLRYHARFSTRQFPHMSLSSLNALSPIDGRYARQTRALVPYFSEYGLIRYRVLVEVRWLQQLAALPGVVEVPALSSKAHDFLESIIRDFDEDQAARVKAHEAVTNHDVKA